MIARNEAKQVATQSKSLYVIQTPLDEVLKPAQCETERPLPRETHASQRRQSLGFASPLLIVA